MVNANFKNIKAFKVNEKYFKSILLFNVDLYEAAATFP